jgi:hypothetical protein
MTLPEIQNALQRLIYIHPLTETNVEEVVNSGTGVIFRTRDTGATERVRELEGTLEEIERLARNA